jgi:flavin reductase (DIM6/NTAB) family NADH-FMN oxidoreductase RutF
MEAGDHWVVYAEVLEGEVQKGKESELTAVHHRKAGTHY